MTPSGGYWAANDEKPNNDSSCRKYCEYKGTPDYNAVESGNSNSKKRGADRAFEEQE